MSVLVVGMSHKSAPVALLEKLSMDVPARRRAAVQLTGRPSLSEAMIVSTCNRLEIYVVAHSFHPGVQDVVAVLHDASGVDAETLRSYLYVRYADAAAEHMLAVTAGLDSMVVGEQQIIGQMRAAYQEAADWKTVGPVLHTLAQTALHTGKRVHSETAIDDAGASMVSYALDGALEQLGVKGAPSPLAGRAALVLGAGAMASLAATHLGRLGISRLIIANRTRSRAERLADHARQAGVDAEVVDFSARRAALARVDIAVSAIGAHTATITGADIPQQRTDSLTLVDLSMPRDITADVTDHPGVHLINIEQLHQRRAAQTQPGAGDGADNDAAVVTLPTKGTDGHAQALRIVAEELESYTTAQRVRDIVPAVAALRRHANELVSAELRRLRGRTPDMDEQEFDEVSRSLRRVVDKLLHNPTVKVKQLAADSGTVSYDSALQELFGLDAGNDQDRSVAVEATALPAQDFRAGAAAETEGRTANECARETA
ncbi:glutamyl-tRNA reductase [Corynebacterium uberis]|uniref:glutamyl-tRNA reductase n=1 Tax=Corynebacterium TaxID=1716 RepID=UPI001D0A8C28|nr:glutamyl-tRNA reductase [uncultured Corynebacterium sp.]MCZ9309521.1 glutamyl-tRNA reductase [Corynebacterium sp. c6VSa_13]UDL73067.1 glutamyl-tRNA reductase [Corynebacterium uberis]UDL76056.1 glutamyl-tRNA reductase [Corynebacterium uberis]UDL78268.1 glutamyl-tRNA reductase [Corynebacterium uberis]UDL80551.1 glutamyl-tRNA reductase [Corynebacterium uberis]